MGATKRSAKVRRKIGRKAPVQKQKRTLNERSENLGIGIGPALKIISNNLNLKSLTLPPQMVSDGKYAATPKKGAVPSVVSIQAKIHWKLFIKKLSAGLPEIQKAAETLKYQALIDLVDLAKQPSWDAVVHDRHKGVTELFWFQFNNFINRLKTDPVAVKALDHALMPLENGQPNKPEFALPAVFSEIQWSYTDLKIKHKDVFIKCQSWIINNISRQKSRVLLVETLCTLLQKVFIDWSQKDRANFCEMREGRYSALKNELIRDGKLGKV